MAYIKDIRFDRLGVETVETYISKNKLYTEKLREKVNKSLANLSEKDRKFYIWGVVHLQQPWFRCR